MPSLHFGPGSNEANAKKKASVLLPSGLPTQCNMTLYPGTEPDLDTAPAMGVRKRTDSSALRSHDCHLDLEITMTSVRPFASVIVLSSAALATLAWAVADDQHNSHHPAATTLVAQAQLASPAMGMGMRAGTATPGAADQMKAMHQMHDKMMAAKPADMAVRQGMMDRTKSVLAAK